MRFQRILCPRHVLPSASRRLALVPILALLGLAGAGLAALPAAADGLTAHDVAELVSIGSGVVSPDGAHVAYLRFVPRDPFEEENGPSWRELHVLGPDGQSRPYISGEVSVGSLSWTPDGSAIAYLSEREDDEHTALYTIPLAGGESRRLVSHETGVDEYAFSPDGRRVAFLATPEEPEGRQERIDQGFDAEIYEEELQPVQVWLASIDEDGVAGEAEALDLAGSATELSWSPDGGKLAVALAPTPLIDDRYMRRQIHVVDVATGSSAAEIANPGKLGTVRWSPDGSHLALISAADLNDPSPGRITVAPATGGAPVDLLPGYEGEVVDLAWIGADALVFVGHEGVWASLHRIGRDGSGHRVLVPGGGPIWGSVTASDDGSRAALVAASPEHPAELFTWTVPAIGDGASTARSPQRRTDSNPWLAERRLARQEVVKWTARDGLELEGVLTWPLDYTEGTRYPLILSVHGGPESHESNGWMTGYGDPGQVAAARGFAVLNPNYRGSTGYGVEFSKLSQGDPAGKEFDDLVDAVDHLVAIGLADGDRVGITGGSYGGYATAWASTYYSERFAAGVMFVGISDKIAKAGTTDIAHEENLVHARAWPWEKWDLMRERSPSYHVEKARTPLLILHGKEDPRVHPSQSMILYRFLKTLGQTPVRLVFYPGEGHGNRKAAGRLDYNLRMMRWFEHYLAGDGGEPPDPEIDPRSPERIEEEAEEAEEEAGEEAGENGGGETARTEQPMEVEDLTAEELSEHRGTDPLAVQPADEE